MKNFALADVSASTSARLLRPSAGWSVRDKEVGHYHH
jgi:hypothetical protein